MRGAPRGAPCTQTGTDIEFDVYSSGTNHTSIRSHTAAVTGSYRLDRCFSTIVYHILVPRATYNEHASGSPFTGWGSDVQALQDTPHHGQWKCVLECAPWAHARVCSRARVWVCRAGAAECAYPRRKRLARSRAAELPDLAASARAPAMPCTVHGKFFRYGIF